MSLNRIYQGKVTFVKIPDPLADEKWLLFHHDEERARVLTTRIPELRAEVQSEIEHRAAMPKKDRGRTPKSAQLEAYEKLRDEQSKEWQSALGEHHQLFQDAVNYYAFALAAMAEGLVEKDANGKPALDDDGQEKKSWMAEFAQQLRDKWEDFTHKGTLRKGLKWSLKRMLNIPVEEATWEKCANRVLALALEKFPNRKDAKGNDVFHGIIRELFPARNRGNPKNLANADAKWLCWAKKTGETPHDENYRKTRGAWDFMAELFLDDADGLKKLAALSVQKSYLTGIDRKKEVGEAEEDSAESNEESDAPQDANDSEESFEVQYEGDEAVTKLEQCLETAKSLLSDAEFSRNLRLVGGERFNRPKEWENLAKMIESKRKEVAQSMTSLRFQKWKTQGLDKDNERVELFVLFHCTGGSDFTATLLKARLIGKGRGEAKYVEHLFKTDKKAYIKLVEKYNLCGNEDGKESPEKVEKARKAAGKQADKPTQPLAEEIDFIKLVRDAVGGFIIPSFTAIRGFRTKDASDGQPASICKPGEMAWIEFDNSAYEEAIKSPHQIRQKKKERDAERKKLKALEDLYQGNGRMKGKNDDDEVEDFIPGGFRKDGDPRFAVMERIRETLRVEDGVEPGQFYEYTIRESSLRGYDELREAWNKEVAPDKVYTPQKADKLLAILKAHQREHRDDVGAVRLFEEFLKEGNWCVWQDWSAKIEKEPEKNYSSNFVQDYLRYVEIVDERKRLKREIQYTPADESESRRLFDFKGAKSGGWFKHGSDADGLWLETQIAIKLSNGPKPIFAKQPVRIHYTAPRLLRDEARVLEDKEELSSANWAQPLMRALGVPDNIQHDFKEHAVSLMPDWNIGNRSDAPDRFLLNFVLTPNEDKFITHIRTELMGRKKWPWDWQFLCYGKGKAPKEFTQTSLCWPHENESWEGLRTRANKAKLEFPGLWFADPNLKSFRFVSVDLGQKQAGAYAIIEVSCRLTDEEKKRARFIGRTEHNGERRDWYARVVTMGLLKLPGENAIVFRPDYTDRRPVPGSKDLREELSGSAGRLATSTETGKTIELLKELQQLSLLDDDPSKREATCKHITFPEQNTKLLIAFRRAQSFASKLHRWCWFLDPQDEVERKDQAARRRTAIKEIAEADEHEWLNKAARAKAKTRHTLLGDAKEEPESHPEIAKALKADLEKLLENLPSLLETIANRIYHSRSGRLTWIKHPDKTDCHLLDFSLLTKDERDRLAKEEKWLAGQRGLSIERIEQLEELRKRCQSLNQMLRREIGYAPKASRDDSIPDPCPTILAKLDEIKEQRRNQTAHMILTQALGLTLVKPTEPANDAERELREAKDSHGEYIKVDDKGHPVLPEKGNKWRGVVDFIIIEDLSRYRTSQGRAPRENSRLMKWCHRAIRDKLKQMCEPFGVPLLETPAAYSSRFCSRTGVAGFRATELSGDPLEESKWRWRIRKPEEGKTETDDQIKRREQWELLFGQVKAANKDRDRKTKGQQLRTLLVPDAGGSIFIPISKLKVGYKRQAKDAPIIQFELIKLEENREAQPKLTHADINAAVNLGLRAVADPRLWSVHSRLRSEREFGTPLKSKPKKGKGKKAAAEVIQTPAEEIKPDKFWVSEKEKRKFGERTDTNRVQILISSVENILKEVEQTTDEAEKRRLREKAAGSVPKASDSRHPNFFADIADLRETHWGAASLHKPPASLVTPTHLVSGKSLWGHVKEQAWKHCMAINAARLRAWGLEPPKEWEA